METEKLQVIFYKMMFSAQKVSSAKLQMEVLQRDFATFSKAFNEASESWRSASEEYKKENNIANDDELLKAIGVHP